eukprot:gb/GECG01009987.1/.p1 GENE.gb/GECG01009987.1/~~gb/GECG01009987.1/.p1  ORF type:complete len:669 (+),score=67.45 gb/GECG01009987.1/:1-2007(+)
MDSSRRSSPRIRARSAPQGQRNNNIGEDTRPLAQGPNNDALNARTRKGAGAGGEVQTKFAALMDQIGDRCRGIVEGNITRSNFFIVLFSLIAVLFFAAMNEEQLKDPGSYVLFIGLAMIYHWLVPTGPVSIRWVKQFVRHMKTTKLTTVETDAGTYNILEVPMGLEFLERNETITRILVLKEYNRIYDQLVVPMLRGDKQPAEQENGGKFHLCCSGISGIGKSLFQLYVIYRVLKEIHNNPGECQVKEIYLRGESDADTFLQIWPVQQYVFRFSLDFANCTSRLLLIDGSMDIKARTAEAHKFLFCSERTDNYGEYKKTMLRAYLPPWTFEEIETLCLVKGLTRETTEHVRELFKIWGGVPRTLFVQPPSLSDVIDNFDFDKVRVFTELGPSVSGQGKDTTTYKILHLFPDGLLGDGFSDARSCHYASTVVAEAVTARAITHQNEYIWNCLLKGGDTRKRLVHRGWEMAAIDFFKKNLQANKKLCNWKGKRKWKCNISTRKWTSSDVGTTDIPKWGPEAVKTLVYNTVNQLYTELIKYDKQRCCLVPSASNAETVDATLYIPKGRGNTRQRTVIFLQPTTSEDHSLKLRGLRLILETLKPIVEPVQITLVFVLPPFQPRCTPKTPQFSTDVNERRDEEEILKKLTVFDVQVTEDGLKALKSLFSGNGR